MPIRPDLEPKEYLEILLRRKWLIVFLVLFTILGASVYCVVTPELYKSSTTILIVPQRIPETYVRSTVNLRIEDRLGTLQQQVMSRTRLMTVIEDVGLFREERRKVPPEALIGQMQKRIDVQVLPGKDAFTISFSHEAPQMAMITTAKLASLFIDENLKAREQQAVGTSEFLESQLEETKKRLEGAEEKLKNYKMHFMGELPQELTTNLTILTRLQDQLRVTSDATRSAEDRRVFLEAQINSLEKAFRIAVSDNGTADLAGVQTDDHAEVVRVELAARRKRVEELTTRYTDRHPEVIRAQSEVAALEKRIAEIEKLGTSSPTNPRPSSLGAAPPVRGLSPERDEIRRLKSQVAATMLEIASLKRERVELQKSVAETQRKVERAPRREQELVALTRDYDNLKASYDDILKKRLEANISQNLVKRQKGEQFQILDPPNLPGAPFMPDRRKVLGMAFLGALALGVGTAFLLEMADPALKTRKDLKYYSAVPILACLPFIHDHRYARQVRRRRAAVMGGFLSFAATAIIFILMYRDKIRSIIEF